MKKSSLYMGVAYLLAGVGFLLTAIGTGFGILFGPAGLDIVCGCGMLCRYVYWTAPQRRTAAGQSWRWRPSVLPGVRLFG